MFTTITSDEVNIFQSVFADRSGFFCIITPINSNTQLYLIRVQLGMTHEHDGGGL
jgi:hypothetical protein